MHPAYRHVQPFTVLWVLLPLTTVGAIAAIGLTDGWGRSLGWAAAILIPQAIVLLALFGRLVIEVHADALRWRFGWLPWFRWTLPLARIERCERIAKAGGSGAGIRGPRDDRLYNTVIGGPALRLQLKDGTRVTLGTPEPDRLQGFIDARR